MNEYLFFDGEFWWFSDESSSFNGPYDTEEAAHETREKYVQLLH